MYDRQEPPFKIELDLVEGCFMRCDFCALHGLPEGFDTYKCMSKKTLTEICKKVKAAGWKSRIVIAGHGEPMKHPHIYECIGLIRKHLPNSIIVLVTNGYGIDNSSVRKLFNSGLSNLSISEYLKFPAMKKIKQQLKKEFDVYDWEDGDLVKNNTDLASPITISMPFEYEKKNSTHKLVNRCGVAFPPSDKKKDKRCAKPFRDMYISYDGTLSICCNDFRRSLKLPNISDGEIDVLWNCEELQAMRKILYHEGRKFFPCNICDSPAYRVGLLPDKMGKETLPEPTEEDYAIVNSCVLDYPLSGYLPRDWEQEEYDKSIYIEEV